jgi:hypothetical protein
MRQSPKPYTGCKVEQNAPPLAREISMYLGVL